MNNQQRSELTAAFFTDAQALMTSKQEDYAHNDNAFNDFEVIASIVGITREQAALCLAAKHIVALARWASEGKMSCDSPQQRLHDVANYAAIMAAMEAEAAREGGLSEEEREEIDYDLSLCEPPTDKVVSSLVDTVKQVLAAHDALAAKLAEAREAKP
jgi:hypothetical protein